MANLPKNPKRKVASDKPTERSYPRHVPTTAPPEDPTPEQRRELLAAEKAARAERDAAEAARRSADPYEHRNSMERDEAGLFGTAAFTGRSQDEPENESGTWPRGLY
jgi:hypothetical protein